MSIALFASPVDNNIKLTPISEKKINISKNKSEKVSNLLKTIHEKNADDEDGEGEGEEGSVEDTFDSQAKSQDEINKLPDVMSLKENYMSPEQTYEYNNSMGFTQLPTISQKPEQNDILIKKLNYLIHLMEEQKDERTNNVTEEVVLYSFLGVFVIFVVDSFVRVGKYVR